MVLDRPKLVGCTKLLVCMEGLQKDSAIEDYRYLYNLKTRNFSVFSTGEGGGGKKDIEISTSSP